MNFKGYGDYGILEIQYQNDETESDMTVFSQIDFLSIEDGSYMVRVTDPPPLA